MRLLVVVPTRNRAALAMKAIGSVLEEGLPDVRLLLSDNSSDIAEATELEAFCRSCPPDVVRYVRPPENLSMSDHWQWAMERASTDDRWTHVAYLTDRMVFRAGDLVTILRIAARNPGKMISFNIDRIDDFEQPVLLQTNPWSGKLFEVTSTHLLHLSSRGIFHYSLPRMLNSVTPRAVIEQLAVARGHVFDSISPDFYFAYQSLEIIDTLLYYDKACLIHYALARSNGASHTSGVPSADAADFDRHLRATGLGYTPLPTLVNTRNVMFNEYCLARSISTSGKLPQIDYANYFAANRKAVGRLEDPDMAAEMGRVLGTAQSSVRQSVRTALASAWERATRRAWTITTAARQPISSVRQVAYRLVVRRQKPGARLYRAHRFATRRLGLAFDSADAAIVYANRCPGRPSAEFFSLFQLLHPRGGTREIPITSKPADAPDATATATAPTGRNGARA